MASPPDRRTMLAGAAAAGVGVWIAPAMASIDAAAAFGSCPGTTTAWNFGSSGNMRGLRCNNRGGAGYDCDDVPPTTTRGPAFALTDMATHTQVTITGTLTAVGGWESGGRFEDMMMVHLDGVRIFCTDNLSNGNPNAVLNLTVAHTLCTGTLEITACVTGPSQERWRYTNLAVTAS